jgi:hypothetical protein
MKNMGNVLAWIQFVVQILPVLGQILAMIESLFPNATGAEKKALATGQLNALIPSGPNGSPLSPALVSNLIDSHVAMLNDAGVFTHAS